MTRRDRAPSDVPALKHGKIERGAVHLCVDMQRMFAEDTPWKTPWMDRVRPIVATIAREHCSATVFTLYSCLAPRRRRRGVAALLAALAWHDDG